MNMTMTFKAFTAIHHELELLREVEAIANETMDICTPGKLVDKLVALAKWRESQKKAKNE